MFGLLNGARTTIRIESTDIRVLSANGSKALRWDSIPVPSGAVSGGRVLDPEAVGRCIAKAFDKRGYGRSKVIASVSGVLAVSRIMRLPLLQGADLQKAIQSETRRVLPASADTMHVFTQIVCRGPEKLVAIALGVPIDTIEHQIRAFQVAGIQPVSFELKPLASLRAVNTPTCVVADLEQDSLDIVVAVDGLPEIMRSVTLAASSGWAQEAFDGMLDELTRIVKFYNDSHRDHPLDPKAPVFLAGALNDHAESLPSVRLPSGQQVQPYLPGLRCPAGFPLSRYLVNIGLALKKV